MTSAVDLAPATTATQDAVTAAARAVRVAEKTPFELAVAAWRLVCDHRDKREAQGQGGRSPCREDEALALFGRVSSLT